MVCFHITTYESREVRGITLQNIWDKTYKHWQILIKTTGSFSGLVSGNCRPGEAFTDNSHISRTFLKLQMC